MVQLRDVIGRHSARHRLDALALTGRKQPSDIQRRPLATNLVLKGIEERLKPPIELLLVGLLLRDRARHAAQWSKCDRGWKEKSVGVVLVPRRNEFDRLNRSNSAASPRVEVLDGPGGFAPFSPPSRLPPIC